MAVRPPSTGQKSSPEPGGRIVPTGGADSVGKARAAGAVDQTEAAAAVDRAAAVGAASQVAEVAAAASVPAVAPTSRTSATERVHSIADRLRRGALTPGQAVEELIEDAVQRSLAGLGADSPLSQELRALLSAFAKDDPYLASQINRLGIHR